MSRLGLQMPAEYSDPFDAGRLKRWEGGAASYGTAFDKLRQNRVEVSYHKYGTAADNFGQGLVDALDTLEKCLRKYQETKNTEYLVDGANYLMFEYMYPPKKSRARWSFALDAQAFPEGPVRRAFASVMEYAKTGDKGRLMDAANCLMAEWQDPSVKGAYFKHTGPEGSAGVAGTPVKLMQ